MATPPPPCDANLHCYLLVLQDPQKANNKNRSELFRHVFFASFRSIPPPRRRAAADDPVDVIATHVASPFLTTRAGRPDTMPGKQEEGGQGPPGSSVCLWLVTVLLLLSLLAGGTCLAAYVLLPPQEAPAWLPAVGLALVALPWAFWILTCAYRCATARAAERRTMAVAPSPGSMCSRSGS